MKARRYLHPDRHLEQDMEAPDMNDNPQPDIEEKHDEENPGTLTVDVGRPMPPLRDAALPTLQASERPAAVTSINQTVDMRRGPRYI